TWLCTLPVLQPHLPWPGCSPGTYQPEAPQSVPPLPGSSLLSACCFPLTRVRRQGDLLAPHRPSKRLIAHRAYPNCPVDGEAHLAPRKTPAANGRTTCGRSSASERDFVPSGLRAARWGCAKPWGVLKPRFG